MVYPSPRESLGYCARHAQSPQAWPSVLREGPAVRGFWVQDGQVDVVAARATLAGSVRRYAEHDPTLTVDEVTQWLVTSIRSGGEARAASNALAAAYLSSELRKIVRAEMASMRPHTQADT
jgi:hypothetical protein